MNPRAGKTHDRQERGSAEVAQLRQLCLASGLDEELKCGQTRSDSSGIHRAFRSPSTTVPRAHPRRFQRPHRQRTTAGRRARRTAFRAEGLQATRPGLPLQPHQLKCALSRPGIAGRGTIRGFLPPPLCRGDRNGRLRPPRMGAIRYISGSNPRPDPSRSSIRRRPDPEVALVAAQVKRDNDTLVLRDAQDDPWWSRSRRR